MDDQENDFDHEMTSQDVLTEVKQPFGEKKIEKLQISSKSQV